MADLTGAPDWYTSWADQVHALGGFTTRLPPGQSFLDISEGALCAAYVNADGSHSYVLAPLFVRLYDDANRIADTWLDNVQDDSDAFFAGYDQGQAAGDAIGSAVSSAVTSSIPWWAWVGGGVVAYGALVTAGILPPLRELLGERRAR